MLNSAQWSREDQIVHQLFYTIRDDDLKHKYNRRCCRWRVKILLFRCICGKFSKSNQKWRIKLAAGEGNFSNGHICELSIIFFTFWGEVRLTASTKRADTTTLVCLRTNRQNATITAAYFFVLFCERKFMKNTLNFLNF